MSTEQDDKVHREKAKEAGRRLVEAAKRDNKKKGSSDAHKAVEALSKAQKLTPEQVHRGTDF